MAGRSASGDDFRHVQPSRTSSITTRNRQWRELRPAAVMTGAWRRRRWLLRLRPETANKGWRYGSVIDCGCSFAHEAKNESGPSKSFACVLHPAANQSLVIHARRVSSRPAWPWPWPGPSPLDFWEPSDLRDWTEKKLEDGEGVYVGAEVAVKIPLLHHTCIGACINTQTHVACIVCREQPVHVQGRSLVADRRPACRIPAALILGPAGRRIAGGAPSRARLASPTYTDHHRCVCMHGPGLGPDVNHVCAPGGNIIQQQELAFITL
uniref:Uncharacterized protein n=1 Tax=Oryza punctata TaxID=4537 RepID=A0A0E0K6M2_ORYPU